MTSFDHSIKEKNSTPSESRTYNLWITKRVIYHFALTAAMIPYEEDH